MAGTPFISSKHHDFRLTVAFPRGTPSDWHKNRFVASTFSMHASTPNGSNIRPGFAARGFTLLETLIAVLICGVAITALFAATGQALHIAVSGRDVVCASQ